MNRKEIIKKVIKKLALKRELLNKVPDLAKDILNTSPEKIVSMLDDYANKDHLSNENYAELIEALANKHELRSDPKIKEQLKILINRPDLHTYLKGLFI